MTSAALHQNGTIQRYPLESGNTLLVIPIEINAWIPKLYEEDYDVWLEYKLWRKELDQQLNRKKNDNPTKRIRLGEVFDGDYKVLGKWGEAVEEVRPKGKPAGTKALKETYDDLLNEHGYTSCFLVLIKQV